METLEILKKLSPNFGLDSVIITGSTALKLHDFTIEVNDLDLKLIEPSKETLVKLEILQASNPNPKFFKGGKVNYSFIVDNVKVDIWIVKSDPAVLLYEGYLVAGIESIIKYKLDCNRPKDWIQFMQLAKQIFNKTLFDNTLESIKDSGY